METSFNSKWNKLFNLAQMLYELENTYTDKVSRIASIMNSNALYDLNEITYACRVYQDIEEELFEPYMGKLSDFSAVWGAIERGDCFPKFPYDVLPAGAYYSSWFTGVWNMPREGTKDERMWWVETMLEQSGWNKVGGEWVQEMTDDEAKEIYRQEFKDANNRRINDDEAVDRPRYS